MPDNLAPASGDFHALRQPQALRLSGPDAVAFAQAQFANDVTVLADGHWQWSAWLNAAGRVLAIFQLLRLNAEEVLLLCHDGGAAALAEQLRRFVFRRKLAMAHAGDISMQAALRPPALAHGAAFAQLEGSIELDVGSPAHPRTLRLLAAADAGSIDDTAELAWRQWDLRFGLPRLDALQCERWTPQQLGLDRLSAYSVKKGCYPGQEIVARTHFLGKSKRALALLQTATAAAPGDEVTHASADIGVVVSSAATLALAVVPLELPQGPLCIGGQPATQLDLLDGLAR